MTVMSEFGSCPLTPVVAACEAADVRLRLLMWVDEAVLRCCGDEKRWEGDVIPLAESSGEIIECERLVPALSDRETVDGAPETMVAGMMVDGALEAMAVGKHWFEVDG